MQTKLYKIPLQTSKAAPIDTTWRPSGTTPTKITQISELGIGARSAGILNKTGNASKKVWDFGVLFSELLEAKFGFSAYKRITAKRAIINNDDKAFCQHPANISFCHHFCFNFIYFSFFHIHHGRQQPKSSTRDPQPPETRERAPKRYKSTIFLHFFHISFNF